MVSNTILLYFVAPCLLYSTYNLTTDALRNFTQMIHTTDMYSKCEEVVQYLTWKACFKAFKYEKPENWSYT